MKKQKRIVQRKDRYRPPDKNQKKKFDRRRTLYYDGNKERAVRQRSHSLGAIIEDLYAYEQNLGGSYQGLNCDPSSNTFSKSFLPRIKLVKSMPIKEDHYSSNQDMYKCPDRKHTTNDNPTTSYRDQIILIEKEEKRDEEQEQEKEKERLLSKTHSYHENEFPSEIINKPDENYFTKNFDECMKRLQIIEKEQEMMEKESERNLSVYNCRKPVKRQMTPTEERLSFPPSDPERSSPFEGIRNNNLEETQELTHTKEEKEELAFRQHIPIHNEEKCKNESSSSSAACSDSPTKGWYSNLRKQFENESKEVRQKETSCRVTGATLKSPTVSGQTTYGEAKEVRHYFSRLVRSNKSLIDEELPDPDKVQNIRAMFQESLKSTLGNNVNKRFGGSLQNINVRQREDVLARPQSAQGNRNDFTGELRKIKKENNSQNSSNGDGIRASEHYSLCIKGIGKIDESKEEKLKSTETGTGKLSSRKFLQNKWTDNASLSSGVSSDLSSYDTDAECCSREVEQNSDEESQDIEDKHYVQNEALEKIRSFGTSVTYFGGQMITCSVGPLLSPTTQAILEEIGEKYPDRNNFTRTFEEFYKKYTENNEPRFKKVGRTRSFGHSDVFHKPNTLNNTEIERYKNDLEIEIGIRKPSGKAQNTLKQKLVKSNSVGSRLEFFEQEVVDKLNEILEAAVEMTSVTEKNEKKNDTEMKEERETPGKNNSPNSSRKEDECQLSAIPNLHKNKFNNEMSRDEMETNNFPPDQLLFGYEKSLLNRERKPDMDFEEFEVCETVEEKMEKIDENSHGYRLTIQVNHQETEPQERETLEEIIINDQEPLDSLEIYLKGSKFQEQAPIQKALEQNHPRQFQSTDVIESASGGDPTFTKPHLSKPVLSDGDALDRQFLTKFTTTSSKWPIETTVMVDIQKNEENTPKLVAPIKSPVKTKTRSFKK